MPPSRDRILWVGSTDPWSPWTLSGISRAICLELQKRDLLHGAIHAGELTLRHLRGPSFLYEAEQQIVGNFRRITGRKPKPSESHGVIGRALRGCPPGTVVVYALPRPVVDPSLPIKRFRWMDLSFADGIRTKSFNLAGLDEAAQARLRADEQRMLRSCEGVVSLSTYAGDSISRDVGYPRELITPIGAGSTLEPVPALPNEASRYSSARILFVGRDWKRKRGDVVLRAFKLLRNKLPHATLTIVGPSERPEGLDDGCRFVGMLNKAKPTDRAILIDLFLSSSVFCMASASEPWGLVYVEAGQLGLPVVALRDWALPDIVVDRVTGRLVSEPTPECLAEALEDVLSDPHRAAEMGRSARARVERVLSWPAVVDRMLSRVLPSALDGNVAIPMQ